MSKQTRAATKESGNKMASMPVGKLLLNMGLPMILSMVLQAFYNVVDTVFVINMGADGAQGNLALSAAFPVQIFMIAVGVGTGVGINALLSKSLGSGDKDTLNKTAGNGLFLVLVFYVLFLLFGLFLAKPYMRLMSGDEQTIKMGTTYLKICCTLSVGSIGFAVAERFLIATGKTLFSMLSQITGALLNVVLDYVFIYPLHMGIAGAAYATVIGQIASFLMALVLHYTANKEIDGNLRHAKPSASVLKRVYKIGFPAFLMQGMLAVMMFCVLLVIGTIQDEYTVNLLSGGYGIYYKLMQAALFASFGLSNTLITVTSFNYGKRDEKRVKQTAFYGTIYTVLVTGLIALLYAIFSSPVSKLFALTLDETSLVAKADVISVCKTALKIATLGYVFMGFTVAVQGVLQGFGEIYSPLLLSALRLIVFVLPVAYLFTLSKNVATLLWWTFPVAEVLTAIFAAFFLRGSMKKHLSPLQNQPQEQAFGN